MAYHGGADLVNLELLQVNPLLKVYNGPGPVPMSTGPLGGLNRQRPMVSALSM